MTDAAPFTAFAFGGIRSWWRRRGAGVLTVAIVVMTALAILKLGSEFHRLVFSSAPNGAIDLKLRYGELHRWFAGEPAYTGLQRAIYPPQAYVMLWPLLGWTGLTAARWLWALTSVAALAWLAAIVVRESHAETPRERAFAALIVLSMNAVGVTVGNGQLVVHLLPALVAGVLILHQPDANWKSEGTATLLLLVALIKPTLALPFVPVAIVTSRRIQPLVLTGVGYLLLTLFAARFQPTPLVDLAKQWLVQSGERLSGGYGDLQTGLIALGLTRWAIPASLGVLLLTAIWTYRNRYADPWILIGVAALVARLWTYHRVYDDTLILLPMVALFRIAKRGATADGTDVWSAVLLAVAVIAMLAPARMERAGPELRWLFIGGHVVVWLGMLYFLLRVARKAGFAERAWAPGAARAMAD